MSQSELDDLRRAEAELKARIAEITAKRAELEKSEAARIAAEKLEEEKKKPLVVEVIDFWTSGAGTVICSAGYREDLLQVWRSIPGRTFRGDGTNAIPLSSWNDQTRDAIRSLPNVSIAYKSKSLEDRILWYQTAPSWSVEVASKGFKVIPGPGQWYGILNAIPGFRLDHSDPVWVEIPFAEGWRIAEALEKEASAGKTVVYSEEALELIAPQVETRAKLDQLARETDSLFLKTKYPQLSQLSDWFYPHQRVGVEYGCLVDARFILADDTGCGKTGQAIGIFEVMRLENPNARCLTITKASLTLNFAKEVEKLTGIRPLIIKNGVPNPEIISAIRENRSPYTVISYDSAASGTKFENTDRQQHEYLYMWIEIFKALAFDLLILDEVHQMKNIGTHRFRAIKQLASVIPRVICLSATPIMNRMNEFYAPLHMVKPDLFNSYDRFVETYTWNGQTIKNEDSFRDLIRPFFLRRKKSDILKNLPPINRMTIYHEMSPKAQKVYKRALNGIYKKLAAFDPYGQGGEELNIMSALAKIQRLIQITSADKAEFTADYAANIIENAPSGNGDIGKVLIFARYQGPAYKIAQHLGSEAVCTVVKKTDKTGKLIFASMTPTERHDLFESVRNDPTVKYIVTTEAAKEGHNLEFCNWVVFNDLYWNPASHDQCEGRAYGRLSNPHPIDSYYITATTDDPEIDIEVWLRQMIEEKQQTFETGVEGIESSRDPQAHLSIGKQLINRIKNLSFRK